MAWKNLSEMNSVNVDDLNEYNSRPDERVLKLFSEKSADNIVFYGATGKWMSDLAEMILRAVLETGTTRRKIHLISRFSRESDFEKRYEKYKGLFLKHKIDLVNLKAGDLNDIPTESEWVIYGAGYKFRTTETKSEYSNLCSLFGKVIPSKIFSHHMSGADIVVIGSANGVELSHENDQAKDDAPLLPKNLNFYGRSIRDKEDVLKAVLETGNTENVSKAVILRGGYMTNFTYGGLEKPVFSVYSGKEIKLDELSTFNIISHRDANIYSLLAVTSASNPVTTMNLSGHTVTVKNIALSAEKQFNIPAKTTGTPGEKHLLIDGSKIESVYGRQTDSLNDLIDGQIRWIKNNGYSIGLDHKVGKSL